MLCITFGSRREVTHEEAEEFAEANNVTYIELSAKSADDVEEVSYHMISMNALILLRRHLFSQRRK
jgi:hypothetical protein